MIDQLTRVSGLLVTFALNCLFCPPTSVTLLGETVTLIGGTVIVALPQTFGNAVEHATSWTTC
jgi:hypothetical protein